MPHSQKSSKDEAAKAKCNRQPDAADWPLGKKSQDTERGLGVQGPAGTSALQVKPFWTLALEPRLPSCGSQAE
mgnify:CR=1 FL=1